MSPTAPSPAPAPPRAPLPPASLGVPSLRLRLREAAAGTNDVSGVAGPEPAFLVAATAAAGAEGPKTRRRGLRELSSSVEEQCKSIGHKSGLDRPPGAVKRDCSHVSQASLDGTAPAHAASRPCCARSRGAWGAWLPGRGVPWDRPGGPRPLAVQPSGAAIDGGREARLNQAHLIPEQLRLDSLTSSEGTGTRTRLGLK